MTAMRLPTRILGLILLAACPSGLPAQTVPWPDAASSNNPITPAAYQQPVDSPEQIHAESQPNQAAAAPLPLKPHDATGDATPNKRPGSLSSFLTVGGSLAVVLGIFFGIVWLLRRASPGRVALLPSEAYEILGRAPLANHHQAHLIRCGNKLLLICVTAAGAETLTEITDSAEVERMSALCRHAQPGSPTLSFRQVFQQAEKRHE